MQGLDNYIDQVTTLPSAPRIIVELLSLLAEDDVQTEPIVELIAFDPALTAKVLQRCNSAAAGRSQPVATLHEAVTHLGFNEIFRLVTRIIGEPTLSGAQAGYGIGVGELWKHSVAAAVGGKLLARALDSNENLVFTAALLHDIGKLVLGGFLEGHLRTLVDQTEQSSHSFLEAEKSLLGVDHAEVGGRLLARWHFPESLVQAVRYHHDPMRAGEHSSLAAFAYVGDLVAHLVGHGYGFQAFAVRARSEAMELLKVSPKDLELFVLETHTALKAVDWLS